MRRAKQRCGTLFFFFFFGEKHPCKTNILSKGLPPLWVAVGLKHASAKKVHQRVWGGRAFNFRGRGAAEVDTALWLALPTQRAQLTGPTKILPRLTLRSGGDTDPKFGKKWKWDFGISASRGCQENHHLPRVC